jgi:hypothetical protein
MAEIYLITNAGWNWTDKVYAHCVKILWRFYCFIMIDSNIDGVFHFSGDFYERDEI